MYNLACAYSLGGRTGAALEWLERAVDAGFDNQERFRNDTDLDSLRGNPEFDRIAEKSEFLSLERFRKGDGKSSSQSMDRWTSAVTEYREFVNENPSNGRGWFNLGYSLHASRQYDAAIEAFENAARLDYHPQTATFNIACGNALLGRTGAALDALESAVGSGGIHFGQLEGDADLDSLRDEPRFQVLLEQLEREKHEHEKLKMKIKKKEHYEHQKKLEQQMQQERESKG
jgi:tetratricopeptide (TPR) repeat protein